jgi:hypothetical protein
MYADSVRLCCQRNIGFVIVASHRACSRIPGKRIATYLPDGTRATDVVTRLVKEKV